MKKIVLVIIVFFQFTISSVSQKKPDKQFAQREIINDSLFTLNYEFKNKNLNELIINIVNSGNSDIIYTSQRYILRYRRKCCINKEIDYLKNHFTGDYKNKVIADVNRLKEDTLKVSHNTALLFKYKVKYCISDCYFVIRLFSPSKKKGKKVLIPISLRDNQVIIQEISSFYD